LRCGKTASLFTVPDEPSFGTSLSGAGVVHQIIGDIARLGLN